MELNEEAVQLLAAILNVSASEIKEMAESEEGEKQFKDRNAANLKKKFDEGHKKASKLTSKSYSDALKQAFDVDISGETPEEIANSVKEAVSDRDADDVSEETIKAHPAYKALLDDRLKDQQKFNKEVEKKVKEQVREQKEHFEQELKKTKKSSYLSELEIEARQWLVDEGAILHSDPEKQKKQIQKFVKEIAEANDLDKDEEGKFMFSKDGSPLTNSQGHNATVQDLFRDNDYMFSYQKTQQRQSTGLDPNKTGGNGNAKFQHYKGDIPKSDAELNALRFKAANKEISKEAFKEVEQAYEATKSA